MASVLDAGDDRPGRDRLWAAGLTLALLAAGFARERRAPGRFQASETHATARRELTRDGRGRSASTPSEIPARGWKDVLLRVWGNIGEDRITVIAAGVTFYIVLALFPGIAAFVALYGLFADPATINSHLDSVAGFMPGGAIDVIRDQVTRLASQRSATLGAASVIGILTSLWSANAGMKSMFDALNLVYDEKENRGLIKLNAVSLAFTVSGIVLLLVALGAMVVLPVIVDYLGLGGAADTIVEIGRWPVLLVGVGLVLAVLFGYGPSRTEPQWRWITWGSAFAAIVWLCASLLFSWYAANFGSYNKTYGSLGAIIGFMIWIWISVLVILVGSELDAEMEHQTARDTTAGGGKPMGARGARMADTVGHATD